MPPDNLPSPNFIKYPYPDAALILAHLETLSGVKKEAKECIINLLKYRAVRTRARLPRGPSAGVLVPLFVGRSGDLYVLLSRRSDSLRTFAGDTALPGGKADIMDVTVEDTALLNKRREAFEEIGLPNDKERVPLLCVMEPHLAKGEMLVIPVVVLILDRGLQPNLNSSEVTSIFAQPLVAFLSSTPHLSSSRTTDPNNPYHTFMDIPWRYGGAIRLHRFLTGRENEGVKPVFGLTASILIKTATIGYGRTPDFEVQPPNAPTPGVQIAYTLLTPASPLRIACEREGLDAIKAAVRLLCPPIAANGARMIEWGKIAMEWMKLMDAAGVSNGKGGSDGRAMLPVHIRIQDIKKDAIPDLVILEAFLSKTRDVVNWQKKGVNENEKNLSKARRAYPKIIEWAEKQVETACNDDGEIDPKSLLALFNERKDQSTDGEKESTLRGNSSEEENPEAIPRKRDAKL